MRTLDGLSHGSWVTNWHLFLAEKIIKRIGRVVERLSIYCSIMCVRTPTVVQRAFSRRPLGTSVSLD